LNPIQGTPLENANNLTPVKCLSILCLMRFLNPETEIRIAGGREYNLRSLQPLSLYPVNSLFVSNYLTTPGQTPEEAVKMVEDMGFEVLEEQAHEINASLDEDYDL
jgi:biotin synthase